jgi:anthranilate phosphoribosyltransferase
MDGEAGPYRDVTIYNAAGALIVAGKAADLKDGVGIASAAIDDGKAKAALDTMVAITNET